MAMPPMELIMLGLELLALLNDFKFPRDPPTVSDYFYLDVHKYRLHTSIGLPIP